MVTVRQGVVFGVLATLVAVGPPAWSEPPARPASSAVAPTPDPIASKALARLLRVPALRKVTVGVSVRTLDGRTLVGHRATNVLNPASGAKLLTTTGALRFFKPSHRFETRIVGTIDAKGRANGGLTVVGGGDPKLMPAQITALARRLVKDKGLKEVRRIAVDGRIFGGDGVPPAYAQKNTTAGYRASVGAAASHFGAVWLTLAPTRPGRAPTASVQPGPGAVELVNRAVTVAGPRSNIITTVSQLAGGRTRMVVSGQLSSSRKRWKERRRLAAPNVLTGYLLRSALSRLKVVGARSAKVLVLTGDDPAPSRKVLVKHSSAPLAELLRDVNVWSNNFMAETVFALLSRATNPVSPADWADSQRNVGVALEALGLDPASFKIVNGSGLYRATTISPAAMTQLLVAVRKAPKVGPVFKSSLAVSGMAGTLRGRLKGALKGRFVGKTGTLDEVVSLSGYLTTKKGTILAVSLMVNGGKPSHTHLYRASFDRFVRRLYKRL